MGKRPLFVGSVYSGFELDPGWLTIQRRHLDATIGPTNYIHGVYVGSLGTPDDYQSSLVVGHALKRSRNEHLEGLRALVAYARRNSSEYEGILVLDSDAFPISSDWLPALRQKLSQFNKTYAAAVRVENLDCFPHPCIAYAPAVDGLDFEYCRTLNLLGDVVEDIVCRGNNFLPLMKSNRVSIHPVLATIYSGLFYHHGCGSRQFAMRSVKCGYYEGNGQQEASELLHNLHSAPEAFIESLR